MGDAHQTDAGSSTGDDTDIVLDGEELVGSETLGGCHSDGLRSKVVLLGKFGNVTPWWIEGAGV